MTSANGAQSQSSYSLDKYYVYSQDSKGHSSTLRMTHVKVPPNLTGELSALVASKEIPEYRTQADFIRDAIVHRLHYLKDRKVHPALTKLAVQFIIEDYVGRAKIEEELAHANVVGISGLNGSKEIVMKELASLAYASRGTEGSDYIIELLKKCGYSTAAK